MHNPPLSRAIVGELTTCFLRSSRDNGNRAVRERLADSKSIWLTYFTG